MPATLRNTNTYTSSGFNTSHTINFGFTPTAGDLLIITSTQGSATSSFTANWNKITGCTSTDSAVLENFWKISDGTETSFNVVITVTRHTLLAVYDYYGMSNTGNDASGHIENNFTNIFTVTAATSGATLQADELVIATYGHNVGAGGVETINSFSAGYSTLTANFGQAPGSNSLEMATAVQEVGSTGVQTCVATYSTSVQHRQGCISTYYVAPTGTITVPVVAPSLAATQASSW